MTLGPIFLIVLVDLLALTLIIPLLPFYAQRFGASAVEIGFLASSFALCQLVASPVLGRLSDRYGRKRILILSQLGTFAGLVLMARAESLAVLFLARMIDGFTAGNLPLAQAYIADRTEGPDRAKQFGLIGVAFGIGLVLGPALSGWLSGFDWNYPVYLAAGLSLLSVAATSALLPADGPKTKPAPGLGGLGLLADFWRRAELRPWLLAFFVFVFAMGWFTQGLALFAQARLSFGPKEVGYWMAYCGVLGIIVQGGLIGRLVRRFGEARLVRLGFAVDVAGYGALSLVGSFPALLAVSTLFAAGNSCLRPALTALISRKAKPEEQGAVLGLTGSLQSLGMIVGPPLGNWFLERGAPAGWAVALGAVSLLGLLLPRPGAE
jgi:MFS transporter, DHA1 family, tetracycline resistance protein